MAAVTLVDMAPSSAQSSCSPIQFNILSLPDPGNDDASPIDFMLVSSTHHRSASTPSESKTSQQQPYDIHEIQTVAPHSGKYASYFVGSRIISNPALHITTRVDPLFFALAHFQRAMSKGGAGAEQLGKWQPWDQALGDLPSLIMRALNLDPNLNINGINEVGQLGHLIDVSDMCGDDLVLCKFSEERTLKWLVAKFERAVEAMRRRLHEKKRRAVETKQDLNSMQGGSGAFSSSFTVAEEEPKDVPGEEKKDESNEEELLDSVLRKVEEHSIRVGGLQLICGYIPTEWKSKLSKEVGITDEDWMGKKKNKSSASTNGEESNAPGEKRSRSSWENIGQEGADALLQFTSGGSGKSGSVITPGDKKEVRNAQSVGLKRLAKVNTKGMKSMASFFGASKKKKK
eukprot:CAMPEP_0172306040 /NCGR_PEP_ID=MMETSP1058-20130122/7198_1 /TAXON_ID=83371 /ORGANISM="Detonula confervacea, Strain CCMP 353" /LENGTH=400 /DNA_ID=CAMNT_0013017811 /DNA_START=54 /DNA_END=1256 /DNA_ORIENTATION=-